jgi:hypothetical protein
MRIELSEQAWQQVLAILAQAPWQAANPLIMEIGRQMQAQTAAAVDAANVNRRGNSGDHPPDVQ